jgi:putative methyltransferase (TIGR04325 family)
MKYLKQLPLLTRKKYGWFGNYPTWEEAEALCTGYDADNILEKVKDALLKVKAGEAVYERDSVLFDEVEYAWTLLACLEKAAIENENRLSVLDFGGSLGSTYFQNKPFLSSIKELSWNILEQPHFVDCGKKYFQDETLHFYSDIVTCRQENNCNVLLLSSVLQYLENPYEWIEQFKNLDCEYVIIDRTPFTSGNSDRITMQKVPPFIYKATYVCRFFNEEKLLNVWRDKYELLCAFDTLDVSNLKNTYFKGFVLKRKKEC